MKYGRLTFVSEAMPKVYPSGQRARRWELLCDCGSVVTTMRQSVLNGDTRSCGCLAREVQRESGKRNAANLDATTHGMSKTPLYKCWKHMKERCQETFWQRVPSYTGVRHCPEWATFEGFLAHQPAGRLYRPGLVLARFGDVGDYAPWNCRWATKSENAQELADRLANRLPDGRRAIDAAAEAGVSRTQFYRRLNKGWNVTDAATTPTRTPSEAVYAGWQTRRAA